MADAFHQVTIGSQYIGKMVNQFIAEAGIHHALGQCHADRRRNALPERAGGGLNARRMTIFRVTGCSGAKLAKVFNLVQRHIGKTDKIMQRILQHGAVAGRQHEAVAVGPFRRQRVNFQKFCVKNSGNISGPHRQAGVTRIGRLHGVHRKGAYGIGHLLKGHRAGFGNSFCFGVRHSKSLLLVGLS